MSTARKEKIIKEGWIKSLLEGKLEIKDLAGINIDLDMARQAYLQGVQETTQTLIELVKENMATAAKQDLQATAYKQDLQATAIKQDTFIANQGKIYVLTPSDEIQLEDLGEESSWGSDYVKKKQFTILTSGVVRVTGEIKAMSPYTSYTQIRINDIPVDTWSTQDTDWTPKTSDIAIGSGDLLQLWIKSSGDAASYLRYARIRCNSALGAPIIGMVS